MISEPYHSHSIPARYSVDPSIPVYPKVKFISPSAGVRYGRYVGRISEKKPKTLVFVHKKA